MGKKFIDKKNSKTYKLVHRSWEDPQAFEEGSTDRVFVEVGQRHGPKADKNDEGDQTVQQSLQDLHLDDIDEEELDGGAGREAGQAALYGISFDDRYCDYTKYLREMGTGGGVILEAPTRQKKHGDIEIRDADDSHKSSALPPEVFESQHRMDIRSAAYPVGPQPYMDHNVREVLEALECEDEDAEGFDDGFMKKLNADELDSDDEDAQGDGGGMFDDEDEDFDAEDVFAQVVRMKEQRHQIHSDEYSEDEGSFGEDAASTGFSMSSSAMYRNDKLTLLDEHFDKVEAMYQHEDTDSEEERYDSDGNHIPEYDSDGNEKISTRPDFESVLDEFLTKYERTGKKMQVIVDGGNGAGKLDTYRTGFLDGSKPQEQSRKEMALAGQRMVDEDEGDQVEAELDEMFREKEQARWDCQSILSTYSTLDNHPAMIHEGSSTPRIRVSGKSGFPVVEGAQAASTGRAKGGENKGVARRRDETAEEKRARKKQQQEEKRARREQKKDTREEYAVKKDRRIQSRRDRQQYVVHLA
ncbi:Protein ltv1 [Coemansia guatemalensis]|uniref:Protein ltv1 n=1 Tax=Coemansia guatemalensis TaxID=2761395 RepID=A0A9W8I2G7_9FUNG|nr:Protein ltv1 [Coemansia guatemalensis]